MRTNDPYRFQEKPSPTYQWGVIPLSPIPLNSAPARWFVTKAAAEHYACRFSKGECVVGKLW